MSSYNNGNVIQGFDNHLVNRSPNCYKFGAKAYLVFKVKIEEFQQEHDEFQWMVQSQQLHEKGIYQNRKKYGDYANQTSERVAQHDKEFVEFLKFDRQFKMQINGTG